MNYEDLERAAHELYACDDIVIGALEHETDVSETEDGYWVCAWVYVPTHTCGACGTRTLEVVGTKLGPELCQPCFDAGKYVEAAHD